MPFEEKQVVYRRRKIIESLSSLRPKKLLEVGCGLEPLFAHYNEFTTFDVVEPAEKFFMNACQKANGDKRITVYSGTLDQKIDILTKQSYDFISLSSLLHEIPEPEKMLEDIYSISSHETIIHINVPNAKSLHRLLAYEMGLIPSLFEKSEMQKKMQQSQTFCLESLSALIENSGFKIIEKGTFFIKPFTHQQMEFLDNSNIFPEDILDGFYSISKYFPDFGSEIYMNVIKI